NRRFRHCRSPTLATRIARSRALVPCEDRFPFGPHELQSEERDLGAVRTPGARCADDTRAAEKSGATRQAVVGNEYAANDRQSELAEAEITHRHSRVGGYPGVIGRQCVEMSPHHRRVHHDAAELEASLVRIAAAPADGADEDARR